MYQSLSRNPFLSTVYQARWDIRDVTRGRLYSGEAQVAMGTLGEPLSPGLGIWEGSLGRVMWSWRSVREVRDGQVERRESKYSWGRDSMCKGPQGKESMEHVENFSGQQRDCEGKVVRTGAGGIKGHLVIRKAHLNSKWNLLSSVSSPGPQGTT